MRWQLFMAEGVAGPPDGLGALRPLLTRSPVPAGLIAVTMITGFAAARCTPGFPMLRARPARRRRAAHSTRSRTRVGGRR